MFVETTELGPMLAIYRLYKIAILMMLHITGRQYTNSVGNKDRSQEHPRST